MQLGQHLSALCNGQIRHGGEAAHALQLHGKWRGCQLFQRGQIGLQALWPKFRHGVGRGIAQATVGQRQMRLAGIACQQRIAQGMAGCLHRGVDGIGINQHHPHRAPGAALVPLGKIAVFAGLGQVMAGVHEPQCASLALVPLKVRDSVKSHSSRHQSCAFSYQIKSNVRNIKASSIAARAWICASQWLHERTARPLSPLCRSHAGLRD